MRSYRNLVVVALIVFVCAINASAQTSSQTIGGIVQQEESKESGANLERLIKGKKAKVSEQVSEDVVADDSGAKIMVNKIVVEDATLISQDVITKVIVKFEGKELTLKQMQQCADMITDQYRLKGYATSRAYIPQQTIKDGVLIIRVIEGKLGNLTIQGNKYFKTSLLRDKIGIQEAGYFDYSALQRSLVYINEHPDRKAKVMLVPGQTPGTTDVVLTVTDNLPIHVGFEYDNFGSRYIENQRYSTVLEHNNLLGFDDKLFLKYQASDSMLMQLFQSRYTLPINSTLNVGGYILSTRSHLGKEYHSLESGGKANIVGLFANKALKQTDDFDLRLNLGFDYKDIRNELASLESSRDELRIFKLGLDWDIIDSWGRNILTSEADFGIPEFLDGSATKDPHASRTGSGGKFQKYIFNYYRLQPMPKQTSLLFKNSFQFSNHNLTSSEQFQIGGPTSVRGYPPAEQSGDKGTFSSVEWSVPFYMIPKTWTVPHRSEKWYDTLRMVFFYDVGYVNLKNISTSEKENATLHGWGWGTRFNLSADASFRIEVGYPIGQKPSDGNNAHTWAEVVLKF